MKNFKFIDLCAGIGGFRQAFEKEGQCNLTCEIDKFAIQSYSANYQEDNWANDITKIVPNELEAFDLLCAGFPCQAFSLAGKQEGFKDGKGRGNIFFNITDIAKENRPKVLFLENVKNLRSHDKGNTFKVICKEIDDIEYYHKDFLFNAQYFVPQKRERVYIIALDKRQYTQQQFNAIVAEIEEKYEAQKKKPLPQFKDILDDDVPDKYTLSDKLWSFLQAHAQKHKSKGNGFGYGLMKDGDVTARTLTARYYKDGSEVLVEQRGKNPRKLTPREAARLMGYPDNFKIAVSDTQAYKQFGNSVVVPVIKMVGESLIKCLKHKP